MGHTLKKYLSNRGSALFMVLSTMTALMICCMAMYFSVISSRSTQYAVFNQQQSYQSASSLSDAFIASLNTGEGDFADVAATILNDTFAVGNSISTGSNGFKTMSADGMGNEDDLNTGAYSLTIKRLDDLERPDGSKEKSFDLIVTSSINGSVESFHALFNVKIGEEESVAPAGPSNIFTATGYVPNDVFIDGGELVTDIFLDNEHTVVNAYNSTGLNFKGNLICAGSLSIYSWLESKATSPVTFAVRGNYANYSNQCMAFPAPTGSTTKEKNQTRSTVLIGGNYNPTNSTFKNANVYVLGNLVLEGYGINSNCDYFVAGKVICKGNYWYNLSNVHSDKGVDSSQLGSGGGINAALAGAWTGYAQGPDVDGLMTIAQMQNKLAELTATLPHYKWIVDYTGVDLSSANEKTINFSTSATNKKYTYYLGNTKKNDGCVIKDVTVNNANDVGGDFCNLTLVIDTGEDPDNTYTIKLKPNRDFVHTGDDPTAKETFCFFPRNTITGSDTYAANSNINFSILTMGRGSVIIDIPDGIIYQEEDRTQFMHYGWFAINGGQEIKYYDGTETTKKERIEHTVFKVNREAKASVFEPLVHRGCGDGDGCTYTETTTGTKCTSKDCTGKIVEVTCPKHGLVESFCSVCQSARKDNHAGVCNNRVDRPAVDAFITAHPSMPMTYMKDSEGKTIYPNVNIFLVSCDENANIRISARVGATPDEDAKPFMMNSFFGFIYAPYMTYKAKGDGSGGGFVKFMGGLVVSDYIIDDSYTTLSCWPDKLPEELMDKSSFNNALNPIVSKSWKVSIGATG